MISLPVSFVARSLRCLPVVLIFAAWATPSFALPAQSAPRQAPRTTQPLDPFYAYLNDQKYTLYLGDSRGACAYHIDPTDVYANGESRFVMAKVSSGTQGTACRGVLAFEVLQADCSAKILYGLTQLTTADSRSQGWRRFEFSLYASTRGAIKPITTQELARKVCALPTKTRR
jgi:hypothetical protein